MRAARTRSSFRAPVTSSGSNWTEPSSRTTRSTDSARAGSERGGARKWRRTRKRRACSAVSSRQSAGGGVGSAGPRFDGRRARDEASGTLVIEGRSGLVLFGDDLGPGLPVGIKALLLPGRPGLAERGIGEIPVRPATLENGAEVAAQLLDGGPAEEPVPVVDAEDLEPRLEHQGVRDHRVVRRVGVLGDVEVLLDLPSRVREEDPVRAD